jgi:hypothetical protein
MIREELQVIAKRFNEMLNKSNADDGSLTPADICDVIQDIPVLFTEIERLTIERNAAVKDLESLFLNPDTRVCRLCWIGDPQTACGLNMADYSCKNAKWRGVKDDDNEVPI